MEAIGLAIGGSPLMTGERVVYPNGGICRVKGVESKTIAGQSWVMLMLEREEDGATVMVPESKVNTIGLRKVATQAAIDVLFEFLTHSSTDPELDWKVRHRENFEKMAAGGLLDTAQVLKGLHALAQIRPLPTKEREMYDSARHQLVGEIAAALNIPAAVAENNIDYALSPPPGSGRTAPKDAPIDLKALRRTIGGKRATIGEDEFDLEEEGEATALGMEGENEDEEAGVEEEGAQAAGGEAEEEEEGAPKKAAKPAAKPKKEKVKPAAAPAVENPAKPKKEKKPAAEEALAVAVATPPPPPKPVEVPVFQGLAFTPAVPVAPPTPETVRTVEAKVAPTEPQHERPVPPRPVETTGAKEVPPESEGDVEIETPATSELTVGEELTPAEAPEAATLKGEPAVVPAPRTEPAPKAPAKAPAKVPSKATAKPASKPVAKAPAKKPAAKAPPAKKAAEKKPAAKAKAPAKPAAVKKTVAKKPTAAKSAPKAKGGKKK